MKIKDFKKILGFFALVFLFGCNDIFKSGIEEENGIEKSGLLTVSITDAPFPVEFVAEANITVDSILLKKVDVAGGIVSGIVTGKDKDDDKNLKRIVIVGTKTETVNLLDLTNGVSKLLTETQIPTGNYDEIWLCISKATVKLDDGTVFDVKNINGRYSAIKIKIKPVLTIDASNRAEVLLDVDLSHSFVCQGNPKNKHGIKGFIFKPVIRAVNLSASGELYGTVSSENKDKVNGAFISLISGNDTIATAITKKDGFYAIIGVPEGGYSVACEKEGYTTKTAESISITKGKKTELNFTLEKK